MENRIFPLSMSVDYRNREYEIIYGIPGLSRITGQEKESESESQAQAVSYRGRTIEEAEERFNQNQEKYLDMGHLKALILGEEVLEEEEALTGLLAYLEEKPAVAGNLYVFCLWGQ
ncbi:DUF4892 domain-containing protein [Blautia argi]|uniref:DUF4892 domain-containing protein n=1 Tax=Blautia argi TaxID=1912897 RepID=UPI001FA868BB|nr:DUF4892 domain-containing protein [Blautia argi]